MYFGALFQLICIAAVVIVPENSNGNAMGKVGIAEWEYKLFLIEINGNVFV